MIITAPVSKPKLKKAGGVWFCSDGGGFSGQGPTQKDAFRAYKQTRKVMDRWGESDAARYYGSAAENPFYDPALPYDIYGRRY